MLPRLETTFKKLEEHGYEGLELRTTILMPRLFYWGRHLTDVSPDNIVEKQEIRDLSNQTGIRVCTLDPISRMIPILSKKWRACNRALVPRATTARHPIYPNSTALGTDLVEHGARLRRQNHL